MPPPNRAPVADLALVTPLPIGIGQPVEVDASGTTDIDGPIHKCKWNIYWGQGSDKSLNTGKPGRATYASGYTQAAPHDIVLEVIDHKGGRSSARLTVDIQSSVPLEPVDCVLDDPVETFGPWGSCQADGTQTRTVTWTRAIMTEPANGGAACGPTSGSRVETQACHYVPPTEGDENAWFEAQCASAVFSYSLRTQTQLRERTINTQGLGEQWTYVWPGAPSADCYCGVCNDPHPVSPNGAKLLMPPTGWRRDRVSYPDGAFLYPQYAPHNSGANEGVSNAGRLRFPIGASKATGWDSATIVFDFWWDATYYSERGGLCGWKNFFVQSGPTATNTGSTAAFLVDHVHLCAPHPKFGDGEVAYSRFQGVAPASAIPGVVGTDPWSPTGLGAHPKSTYPTMHSRWVRTWIHVELDRPASDFADWMTLTGVTLTGTFNSVSLWEADEHRPAARLLYKVPMRWPTSGAGVVDTAISAFGILFDQSNTVINQHARQVLDLATMEVGDTFTLTVPAYTNTRVGCTSAAETTAPIAFSENMATAIDAALQALRSVDLVTVVKGSTSQSYTVTFTGSPSGMVDIPNMVIQPTDVGGVVAFAPTVTCAQQGGTLPYQGADGIQSFYARNVLIFKNHDVVEGGAFFEPPKATSAE